MKKSKKTTGSPAVENKKAPPSADRPSLTIRGEWWDDMYVEIDIFETMPMFDPDNGEIAALVTRFGREIEQVLRPGSNSDWRNIRKFKAKSLEELAIRFDLEGFSVKAENLDSASAEARNKVLEQALKNIQAALKEASRR